jgi:Phosphoesterase family
MSAQNLIKHVVFLLMENHSFDQMLGCVQSEYPALDGVDVESQSPRFNLDLAGNKVFQLPTDQQQLELDPKHEKICARPNSQRKLRLRHGFSEECFSGFSTGPAKCNGLLSVWPPARIASVGIELHSLRQVVFFLAWPHVAEPVVRQNSGRL